MARVIRLGVHLGAAVMCAWPLAPAVAAQPARYTVVELEAGSTVSSISFGINASGVVVGMGQMPGGGGAPTRAVLWSNRVLTDLGSLNGNYNTAYGINDNTQVVGYSEYISDSRAFRLERRTPDQSRRPSGEDDSDQRGVWHQRRR